MPKVKLSKSAQKEPPPIDWLWAAILERKAVMGYDLKRMAAVAGVSYETMRRYIRVSPWKWEDGARARVCERFGIRPNVAVQVQPTVDWGDGR